MECNPEDADQSSHRRSLDLIFSQLIRMWVRILPIALAAGVGLVPSLLSIQPVSAQTRIPKLPGYNDCPLGYVNDLKQHCVSPINYEVQPTNGQPCPSGWMNIGAGYCKKKTLGIF